MSAEYPSGIFSPRTKENKSGVVYDETKKTVGYAEDFTKLDEEVVAVETELGTEPKGTSASVEERLKGIRSLSDANADVLVVKGGNVGIWTTEPDRALDVAGLTIFGAGDGGNNNEIMLRGQVQTTKRDLGVWHFSVRGDIGGDNDNLKIARFVDSGAGPVYQDIPFVIENSSGNVGIGTTAPATKLEVKGAITQSELSADPTDPAEGKSVQWQSDGTGSGDDGDIMMKITAGGVTKTTTLIDFSTL